MSANEVRAGSRSELESAGQLLTKVGTLPVVVFWSEGTAFAIEDRCPHLGFPLHQGTVEAGLVTCHWHHARFDLVSGCTLDLWADDARGFDVDVRGDDVFVVPRVHADPIGHLQTRLRNGLEDDITLVIAKSVLGLLDAGVPASEIVRTGVEFGARYRNSGWGAGLTVLIAMANLLPQLEPDDQALALVHGLAFVARDTVNHAPRFAVGALETQDVPVDRLGHWYRRFVDTRSADAAERTLETALAEPGRLGEVETMMFAAVTDHVFIDGGHTIDFTNKAFEAVEHLGKDAAPRDPPHARAPNHCRLSIRGVRRVASSPQSRRARATDDRVARRRARRRAAAPRAVTRRSARSVGSSSTTTPRSSRRRCSTRCEPVPTRKRSAARSRTPPRCASLRFHIQNDHGDWDTVHHAFTAANGLHHALQRRPSTELLRGAVLRRVADQPRPVPQRARGPRAPCDDGKPRRARLAVSRFRAWSTTPVTRPTGSCRAGARAPSWSPHSGMALLAEDAEFHWYQVVEAGVRQAQQWPDGSEESALVLSAIARFLAAHTPTRRELPTVVRIATRLRRGEALYEDENAPV